MDILDGFSKLNLQENVCQTNADWKCDFYPCFNMREIITHIKKCVIENKNTSCQVPHCATTLNVYKHWVYCIANNCLICEPVKQQIDDNIVMQDNADNNVFLKKIPALLAQHHLKVLLHCRECLTIPNTYCREPYCPQVKPLLNHTLSCSNSFCEYFTCAVAKQSLHHWDNCNKTDCRSCAPLKGTLLNTMIEFAECIRYQMLLFSHSDVCLRKLANVNDHDPSVVPIAPAEGPDIVRLFAIVPDDLLKFCSVQFNIGI